MTMRALMLALVSACGCTPKSAGEQAVEVVRGIYAGAVLGNVDRERDVLRSSSSSSLRLQLEAREATCSDILANPAENHGLTGPALAEFERTCLDARPLSCRKDATTFRAATLQKIEGTTAVVDVDLATAAGDTHRIPVVLRWEQDAWKVDDVRCP